MTLQIVIVCILVTAIIINILYKIFGESGPYIVTRQGTDKWVEIDDISSKESLKKIIDTFYS